MKKVIIAVFILLGYFCFDSQAQSYELNRYKYFHKMYIPQPEDPYNPSVMGVASIVSGLGQILSGETGRGLAFMGGTYGAYATGFLLLGDLTSETNSIEDIFPNILLRATGVGFIGIGIALNIWSIIDAVRVAKVNNMYFQDIRGELSSVKVELNPFIDTNNYLGKTNTSAGLSLRVTF